MNAPRLDLAAIAPIAFTGIGALVVLLGEVWLSRRKSFLGREVTEVWIGTVLALVAARLPRPRDLRGGRRRSRAARASPSTSTTRCCASTASPPTRRC